MTRPSDSDRPTGNRPQAGRDPANKKKFSLVGTDTTTKAKRRVEFTGRTEPAIGSVVTGKDKTSGETVTITVSGRDPAN